MARDLLDLPDLFEHGDIHFVKLDLLVLGLGSPRTVRYLFFFATNHYPDGYISLLQLASMSLKCFLNTYAFTDIFLHSIISFHKPR
jgi:hypothetical protein